MTPASSKSIDTEIQQIVDPMQRTEWVDKPELAIEWQFNAIKALLTTQLDRLLAELPKKSHLQDNPDNLDWIDQWNAVRQQRNTVITEVTEAIKRQREALNG